MADIAYPMNRYSEIRAERREWGKSIDLVVLNFDEGGERRLVAKPLELVGIDDGMMIAEPTMRMSPDQAQQMMDALWDCGIRPTAGSGSAGSLAATQEHLADMRKIAFDLLGSKP